jgi:hypothetical protein
MKTTKKPSRASRSAEPRCSDCRFWIRQRGAMSTLGDCDGALEHARSVVAFAVDITKSATFAHGGRDCPRFQPNGGLDRHPGGRNPSNA